MAVRLQLKLGAVTEQDRLPDSPDTVVIVEPSIGSIARTKGQLYLVVTSRVPGGRAREATRVVADTIRNEYYYDESAGIRSCIVKALALANKRLGHQRDRYGLGHQSDGSGPIGVAVAVVRGRELYVSTVGPAEAYLIRQARLSTLPDPYRERGLPTAELEPDVWRGELSVGDSLCLVSANLVSRIGTESLKDALVTLHPQSAVEHLHGRFVAADGTGSDAALAFEATEVGATHKAKALVPVRAAEPLAGAPDRSPIPLADSVTAGAAALGAGATRARTAAGNRLERLVWRAQDLLPRRGPGVRRVTPATRRFETQRRAAIALLALLAVSGSLVLGVYAFGGGKPLGDAVRSINAAQQALDDAQAALHQVSGPGVDLITNDPGRALQLLNTAYTKLDEAERNGYSPREIAPLRQQAQAGLDRLYKVVPVHSTTIRAFKTDKQATNITSLVQGSDGAAYALDAASKTVWRISANGKTVTAIAKAGQRASGTKIAEPRFLTTGGPDVLILDAKNVLWRWRPANRSGRGTLVKIRVVNSASWGDDIRAISTFVANYSAALYKLYVVDPSAQNIMVLSPSSDGSGYPVRGTGRLPTARPVDGITDLFIDGDIFVAENGQVSRLIPAQGWQAKLPDDAVLRPSPSFTLLSSPTARRTGLLYAFDAANDRIVAFNKSDGAYVEQYRLAAGDEGWADLRDMVVLPAPEADAPATVWWVSKSALHSALLEAAPDVVPGPSPSSSAPASPRATPKKTPKP